MVKSTWGNDYSDIDGDGNQLGGEDFDILEDSLNSTINYLPSKWDSLKTRGERDIWADKMRGVDKTEDIIWEGGQKCTKYAVQTCINFNGYEEPDSSFFSFEDNCRFNIPTFVFNVHATGLSHAYNCIFTGDSLDGDPRIFENLYLFDVSNGDQKVNIGDWNLPGTCNVSINKLRFYNGHRSSTPFLKFTITNSIPECTWHDPNLQLQRNPPEPVDSIAPLIDIISPNKKWHSFSPNLEAKFSDPNLNLDSSYYELNGTKHFVNDSILDEPLVYSVEGGNKLKLYAEDYFQNSTADSLEYFLDTTKPEIFASVNPLTQELEYILEDDNLDLSNSYVVLNGGEKDYFTSPTGSKPLYLTEGYNSIKIHVEDSAKNVTLKEIDYYYTSTEQNEIEKEFKVYPNPATDKINVEYSALKPEKIYTEIYNFSGRLEDYFSEEIFPGKGKLEYNISNYNHGIYLISVTDSEGTRTGKIIKK